MNQPKTTKQIAEEAGVHVAAVDGLITRLRVEPINPDVRRGRLFPAEFANAVIRYHQLRREAESVIAAFRN